MKRYYPLLLMICIAAPVAFAANKATPPPLPSVEVKTAPPQQMEVSEIVKGLGAVTASDEATTDISFLHPGQVADLSVQTGERVTKGQRLAELTADPSALQNFEKAIAALNFAKQDLERTQTLLTQHLATNAQLAAAQKAYDDAVAAVATERKLGDDKATEVAAAPFDGFVVKLMVALGDRIQSNAPLMKLARTDVGARVAVGLPADEASRVVRGMKATVTAVMNAKPRSIAAQVGGVSDSVNPASRLIDCWLTLSNPADRVPEGTSVNVAIIISQHSGWVVPRQAVLKDDKGSYVFQTDGVVAHRVDVQTGIETETKTEISGPFDKAKPVVIQGNYELRDGMKVREPAPPSPK